MAKKKPNRATRRARQLAASKRPFNINFDIIDIETREAGEPTMGLQEYLATAKTPADRAAMKAAMLSAYPEENAHNRFMARRPRPPQAFLCATDAIYLLHAFVNGERLPGDSDTIRRSEAILVERGLIILAGDTLATVTHRGHDVVNQILALPCGGLPKPFFSVTEENGKTVARACSTGGRDDSVVPLIPPDHVLRSVCHNLNRQSIPRENS